MMMSAMRVTAVSNLKEQPPLVVGANLVGTGEQVNLESRP